MNLPTDYKKEIEKILRNEEEYKKFIESYNKPSFKGIRINTLKVSEDRFKEIFKLKKVWTWSSNLELQVCIIKKLIIFIKKANN